MQYDSVGNRTSESASVPASTIASGSTSYTLDGANELTREVSGKNGGFTNNFACDTRLCQCPGIHDGQRLNQI